MNNHFLGRFLTTLMEIRSWPGDLLFANFFITPTISAREVGFVWRAIDKGDWRDSMIIVICGAEMGMR